MPLSTADGKRGRVMVDKTTEETIQKRDIIVTQIINELGVTIETNTKPLIYCKDCKHRRTEDCPMCNECGKKAYPTADDDFCSYGERIEE